MAVLCEGCGKELESKLRCPKCLALKLEGGYFCGPDCFKANWKTHSVKHVQATSSDDADNASSITVGQKSMERGFKPDDVSTWLTDFNMMRFREYKFTGPLRPYPRSLPPDVPSHIPFPDYAKRPGGRSLAEERARGGNIKVYSAEEIERLRACCLLGRKALDLAHTLCKVGTTPEEIDNALFVFITSNGAYPSPLGYYGFPKAICTSVNEVVCHGIPDLRPLEDGDIINVDVTVYLNGMHGDLNETFCVGEVDEASKKLIKAAHDGMMAGISICKPKEMFRNIGKAIADVVEPQGFSVVTTYCGHGIGDLFHTSPNVPHYRQNKAKGMMQAGQVFTVEPMINSGKYQDEMWPDQWTAVTVDGKRSAQFEHQILITETGCEILTARLPDSPKLWWEV